MHSQEAFQLPNEIKSTNVMFDFLENCVCICGGSVQQGHSLSTFWFCSWWCTCQLSYLQHQHKLSFCHKNKWCSVFSFNRRYDVIQERAWFRACLTLIFKKGCFFKHNMEMTKSEKLLKKTKKNFLWIFFDMTSSKKGRGLEFS